MTEKNLHLTLGSHLGQLDQQASSKPRLRYNLDKIQLCSFFGT